MILRSFYVKIYVIHQEIRCFKIVEEWGNAVAPIVWPKLLSGILYILLLQPTHYVLLVYYIYFQSLTAILTLAFPKQYSADQVSVYC